MLYSRTQTVFSVWVNIWDRSWSNPFFTSGSLKSSLSLPSSQLLQEGQVDIAGSWRGINNQKIKISPNRITQQLFEGFRDHGVEPDRIFCNSAPPAGKFPWHESHYQPHLVWPYFLSSVFDSFTGFHPIGVIVFNLLHFSDQVSPVDQLFGSIPAGNDDF